MPREVTRQSVECRGPGSGLDIDIRRLGVTVWVTLSGILDRPQLSRLIRRATPLLQKRGCTLVLDGRSLRHIDYRAVPALIAWNRQLNSFGHRLTLYRWSDYLKAIVSVEDWQRELDSAPVRFGIWGELTRVRQGPLP